MILLSVIYLLCFLLTIIEDKNLKNTVLMDERLWVAVKIKMYIGKIFNEAPGIFFKSLIYCWLVFNVVFLGVLLGSCSHERVLPWSGPELQIPRDELTVEQLYETSIYPLLDMSFFSKPDWALEVIHEFSGSISVALDTDLIFPKGREPYSGEDIFPKIAIEFISSQGELIPLEKNIILTRHQSDSFWDVIVGAGRVWREEGDGEWDRASFPLTLTDRYVGQARNCVATFVYKPAVMSNVYVQCSQETASLEGRQVGNIRASLRAKYEQKTYVETNKIIEQYNQFKLKRLSVYPLSEMDKRSEIAGHFEKTLHTNAPTSVGAILQNGALYLHPPKTRHGLYPYPHEMRHGVYSVTKSMAGALALFYFAERFGEKIFDELITDYVPALAGHPGWQDVTFSHTLNMVTGTVGSERMEHILDILIMARTSAGSIDNIATLGDSREQPGQRFNYASTNLFVLSFALQNYVREKEGDKVHYWDLVHENVLVPIGAEYFTLRHTLEVDGSRGIPILAYGAFPTLDEASKIALLFSSGGSYKGQQLLHREKTREAFSLTTWSGYTTNNDIRGEKYQHSFWSKKVNTKKCEVNVTYMLGYGENYVLFLPSDTIIFRFLDEYDLNFDGLVKSVEKLNSSCL